MMKWTSKEVDEILARAMSDSDSTQPRSGRYSFSDLESHARGMRLLSKEELLQAGPSVLCELAYLQREIGRKVFVFLTNTLALVDGLLAPERPVECSTSVSPSWWYPLIISGGPKEDPEDVLRTSYVSMPWAAVGGNRLVLKLAFATDIAARLADPRTRAVLQVWSLVPVLTVLGSFELATGEERPQYTIDLPSDLEKHQAWTSLGVGGNMPFALSLVWS